MSNIKRCKTCGRVLFLGSEIINPEKIEGDVIKSRCVIIIDDVVYAACRCGARSRMPISIEKEIPLGFNA